MNKAVAHFHEHTTLTLYEAINLATKNPAEALGLFEAIGSIDIGKDADLLIMSPTFDIIQTYCKGLLSYDKEEDHAY